ncbi:aminomethyl-transferring glycine dehydrogenase subunit GcvPA [Fusibacter bizertensis]|uniref:Probable glycine dehydrogenase (decarboxylating) subunit 1 n=1 Tax=Fusibacter bizertensis TaxID=1488331 RepID=A0ABT6NG91_9FIRM|nr:aminomethyl-transferring glycine dehydrogenase subunit GcvPA [Fusibacter bizertensis]MDH8679441.1 aminomethyl-transferring glycine dehydrogenase subunit GcvPA [Fusibacter bizertensis]
MFPYIPNTKQDEQKMLEVLGIDSIDRLFDDIPEAIKLGRRLDLGKPLSEIEVSKKIKSIANKNIGTDELVCFRGAGAYDHSVPSVIHHLISRSEFYTAYTPYQPEISQGTLQAIFEYQTMIANLTGLEVSNASMYDGASATAEAAMLAAANQKGDTIVISETVHPQTRDVVKTYMRFYGVKVVEVPAKDGITDMEALKDIVTSDTVGVIIQTPNFFGNIEDCTEAVEVAHANKALFIMNVDPISLGMLKTPGEYGADLAVGEGQVLGNSLNYGGPYLGFMAASTKQMRKLPGRIAGQTVDLDGKRAFTLTLQAREQHIRRDKATSNICSNQALNALAATIYLGALGKEGLAEVAEESAKKAYYAYNKLIATGKFKPVYDQPFFREFVLETTMDVESLNAELASKGFLGGYNVGKDYKSDKNLIMFCVTEKRTIEEIDCLVKAMEEISW